MGSFTWSCIFFLLFILVVYTRTIDQRFSDGSVNTLVTGFCFRKDSFTALHKLTCKLFNVASCSITEDKLQSLIFFEVDFSRFPAFLYAFWRILLSFLIRWRSLAMLIVKHWQQSHVCEITKLMSYYRRMHALNGFYISGGDFVPLIVNDLTAPSYLVRVKRTIFTIRKRLCFLHVSKNSFKYSSNFSSVGVPVCMIKPSIHAWQRFEWCWRVPELWTGNKQMYSFTHEIHGWTQKYLEELLFRKQDMNLDVADIDSNRYKSPAIKSGNYLWSRLTLFPRLELSIVWILLHYSEEINQ